MRRWRVGGWGWGVLAAWALPALAIVALWNGWLVVPDRWNPWAPLWPQERPNLLTRYKLQRLASDPLACAAALRATTLVATPVPDRALAGGCGWHDAVRVQAPASGASEGSERRSEHATANALDVARFTLADGTSVSVARDWQRGAADPRGRFLREVHDGACGLWSVVLGPAYDAAHRDHFHLDRGASRLPVRASAAGGAARRRPA